MTHNGHIPTRRNRRNWTAYERSRNGVGFDHDAASDLVGIGLLLDHPTDWSDVTILNGLSEAAEE